MTYAGPKNPRWKGGRTVNSEGYVLILVGDGHPRADKQGYVREHVLVAEKALGKFLPPHAVVHHVDHNPSNNAPSNLVVCNDHKYHTLLHLRERALAACGDASAYRCHYCKQYDRAENMLPHKAGGTTRYHRRCQTALALRKSRERRAALAAVSPSPEPAK